MVDLYCERVVAGLLAEPFNLATNLLFILAGIVGVAHAQRRRQRDGALLSSIVIAIGIGSAVFHAFATRWAEWLDVLPILVFQLGYLGCYLRRLAGYSMLSLAAAFGVFIAALVLTAQAPHVLNGSLGYAPALVVLALLGFDYYRAEGRLMLLGAASLFVVALAARCIDNAWCQQWPWGTHFIWHTLNACVLIVLVEAYGLSRRYRH